MPSGRSNIGGPMCFPLLDVSEDIRNGKHSQETFKNKLNRKELGLTLTKITVISNFTKVKAYVMLINLQKQYAY